MQLLFTVGYKYKIIKVDAQYVLHYLVVAACLAQTGRGSNMYNLSIVDIR